MADTYVQTVDLSPLIREVRALSNGLDTISKRVEAAGNKIDIVEAEVTDVRRTVNTLHCRGGGHRCQKDGEHARREVRSHAQQAGEVLRGDRSGARASGAREEVRALRDGAQEHARHPAGERPRACQGRHDIPMLGGAHARSARLLAGARAGRARRVDIRQADTSRCRTRTT